MQTQKVTVRIKNRTFGKLQRLVNREDRNVARMCRQTQDIILEMHAKTMAYRAVLADYERWTKTPEYQEEIKRLDQIMAQVKTVKEAENR